MAVEIGLKVCRKCLTTEGLTSLFEGKPEVLEMLQVLGGISIAKDKGKFEAMICGNCSEELMKLSRDSWKIKNIERLYVQKKRVEIGGELLEEEEGIEEDSRIVSGSGGSSEGSEAAKSKCKQNPSRNQQKGITKVKDKKCEICSKKFYNNFLLRRHIDEVHVRKREMSCDLCGRQFSFKHEVSSHMVYNHTVRHIKTLDESRPFKCSKCPKKFNLSCHLKEHIASVHETDCPLVCKCGKSFKFSWKFKAHQAVHSSVRPFKCHCGKSFKVKGLLKTHKINVHAELF